MNLAKLASFVHKWLALLLGVQILFWVASGLFFTLFPIEQVRSEHQIRSVEPQALTLTAFGSLGQIRTSEGLAPVKITIDDRFDGERIVAEFADGAVALYDAATLRQLSPLDADGAAAIARAHVVLASPPSGVTLVSEETPQYRGQLPAWRVQFPEEGLAVYVAADTGQVTARRSDLWRLYDALWALHIMDWRDHENFNHPLIVATAWLTLASTIAGIVLLPFRIRFGRRRTSGKLSGPSGAGPSAA